jgi:hypothetical protein
VQLLTPKRAVLGGAVGLAVLLVVLGALILPGAIWRGTAVMEPCDAEVRQQYGPLDEVHVLREDIHLRWFPPSWVCPLSNGEEVTP